MRWLRRRVRRSPRRPDLPVLVGGLAVTGMGIVLLLDRLHAITLSFGWLAPTLLAAIGAYLLASGLARGRR
jgi:hypothetical protein